MAVYLPTAVLGNDRTLLTLGHAAEIMGWFYPAKDHAQNIYQCMPCVYIGLPHRGHLIWTWGHEWSRHQEYQGDSNICVTTLSAPTLGLDLQFTDVVPDGGTVLLRRMSARNTGARRCVASLFHYGDWNMGGIRTGNGVHYDFARNALVQSHREAALAIGGDALSTWQCGKAGEGWNNNAFRDLDDGALSQQDLELGDVNWAFGFGIDLHPGETVQRTAVFALGPDPAAALAACTEAQGWGFTAVCEARRQADAAWLQPGLAALRTALGGSLPGEDEAAGSATLPPELLTAYKRSLLCLPLLCGEEGVAVAAPEFDPEFVSCGGYGYLWPRDGAEYVSGLADAGYAQPAASFFEWCARHQDATGLWHQRYFLNGQPGPNWCLPPDMLQIDQVGAVLWAYGKCALGIGQDGAPTGADGAGPSCGHAQPCACAREMVRKAADYLISRLTDRGVHGNAFDTWETFIGSFTYSNAAIYAALRTAAQLLGEDKYEEAAHRVKSGVMEHFVRDQYLIRGFDGAGNADTTLDSASLGAIEPFGLLDLNEERDLVLAEGTLRAVTDRLEVDWQDGRAIRRFEGDVYVGGVPACVNTLWMARCCLKVAQRQHELGRHEDAALLTERASGYLQVVLRRATPTGLLPELMQGPDGQGYWAAPHGWAMASFVSGVLLLAHRLKQSRPPAVA